MKFSLTLLILFISFSHLTAQDKIDSLKPGRHNNFKLSYISVGMGSNMDTQQPRFEVKRLHFIYTLEDAWKFKNVKKNKPIKLTTGFIRPSSIDSILTLAKEVKAKFAYSSNPRVMSGGIIYLNIDSPKKTIHFELHNAKDDTAAKIVAILNEYIPDTIRHLWISDIAPTIIEMK